MIGTKRNYRSRRRTIALEINAQGELIVRAPFRASMEQIMDSCGIWQDWIGDKTRQMQVKKTGAALILESAGEISCIIKGWNCIR